MAGPRCEEQVVSQQQPGRRWQGTGRQSFRDLEQGYLGLTSLSLSDSISHLLPSRYGLYPHPSAVVAAGASGSRSGFLVQAASPRVSCGESGKFWLFIYHPNLALLSSLPPYNPASPRAKGFQHQRMTNGAMNVEIGNPTYKMYEGGEPDDVGGLLDADFALDPDKVHWEDRGGGFQGRDKRLWVG